MSNPTSPGDGATVKYSVPFNRVVNRALMLESAAQRMEPTEIIQRIVTEALINKEGLIDTRDAERLRLFWTLVDRVVVEAQKLCRSGKFASSITLDAIHEAMKDDGWRGDYGRYVGADIFKSGNPEKGAINREIGFRVRAGIGAVVDKDENGKAKNVKVLGEIIQSYTPMADYDRDALGPSGV